MDLRMVLTPFLLLQVESIYIGREEDQRRFIKVVIMEDSRRESIKRIRMIEVRFFKCCAGRMHDFVGLIVNHEP